MPPPPPTVAYLTPGYPAGSMPNGVTTYAQAIASGLTELGAEPHIVTWDVGPGVDAAPGVVHRLPRPKGPTLADRVLGWVSPARRRATAARDWRTETLVKAAHRLHAEIGFDLLELEETFGWPRLLDFPTVARLHGPWFLNGAANGAPRDARFDRRVEEERLGVVAAAGVTAPSHDVLRRAVEQFGRLPPAEVIYNPLPLPPAEAAWSPDAAEPGRILFVGRFDRHKGGDVMLRAFAELAARAAEATLTFVGPERPLSDDEGKRWSLQDYVDAHVPAAARDRVTFTGPLPAAAVIEHRRRAAVVVVPSRYETFSYTAAEAMAAGCPLVVAGAGALPELVAHEQTGLVTAPGDANACARAIERLLEDRPLAASLASAARAEAGERFCPRAIAEQTLAFYRRVLGGPGVKPGGELADTASGAPRP